MTILWNCLGWSYDIKSCWFSKSEEDYYACFNIVRAWYSTLVDCKSIGSSLVEAGREEIWISERSTRWNIFWVNEHNKVNNLHTIWRIIHFAFVSVDPMISTPCCKWNRRWRDYYACFDIVCAWYSTFVDCKPIGSSLVETGREEIGFSYSISDMANQKGSIETKKTGGDTTLTLSWLVLQYYILLIE